MRTERDSQTSQTLKEKPLTPEDIVAAARTLPEISAGQYPVKEYESLETHECGTFARLTRRHTTINDRSRPFLILCATGGEESDRSETVDKFVKALGSPIRENHAKDFDIVAWNPI